MLMLPSATLQCAISSIPVNLHDAAGWLGLHAAAYAKVFGRN